MTEQEYKKLKVGDAIYRFCCSDSGIGIPNKFTILRFYFSRSGKKVAICKSAMTENIVKLSYSPACYTLKEIQEKHSQLWKKKRELKNSFNNSMNNE